MAPVVSLQLVKLPSQALLRNRWQNFLMPKIEASNVADHRERRRAALLAAAVELAMEEGSGSVTMSAVAARAGLSRSSLYEYFDSREDLIADLVLDELDLWASSLNDQVSATATALEHVEAWMVGALEYVIAGKHRLARELSSVALPPHRVPEVRAAHHRLTGPLISALTDAGTSDPARVANFVNGIVEATTRRVDAGNSDADAEARAAIEFALAGVRAQIR